MKRNIALFLMLTTIVFLIGCTDQNVIEETNGEKENMSNIEEYTTYCHNGIIYNYREGIFAEKNWHSSFQQEDDTMSPAQDNTVPDREAAILLASREFEKKQEMGIGQSYVLRDVFYDTEDGVWVVSFGEKDLVPGSDYNIAISKATGEILKMWPGE